MHKLLVVILSGTPAVLYYLQADVAQAACPLRLHVNDPTIPLADQVDYSVVNSYGDDVILDNSWIPTLEDEVDISIGSFCSYLLSGINCYIEGGSQYDTNFQDPNEGQNVWFECTADAPGSSDCLVGSIHEVDCPANRNFAVAGYLDLAQDAWVSTPANWQVPSSITLPLSGSLNYGVSFYGNRYGSASFGIFIPNGSCDAGCSY
jgi:hypothetical protein